MAEMKLVSRPGRGHVPLFEGPRTNMWTAYGGAVPTPRGTIGRMRNMSREGEGRGSFNVFAQGRCDRRKRPYGRKLKRLKYQALLSRSSSSSPTDSQHLVQNKSPLTSDFGATNSGYRKIRNFYR